MKKNYTFKYKLLTAILLLAFCLPISMMGQTTVSFDGGNTTWTVPCGVTSVTVKAWGAGGGAGGSTKNNEGGSGGGGGAYTTRVLAVAPGNVISYQVGVSGGGGDGVDGLSGTRSEVTFGAFTLTAGGGTGGAADKGTIGSGGTASGGTTNTSGSNGVIGTASGGNGGNAANTAGGGGTGGAGVVGGNGFNGNTPGGGGGGGERDGSTNGIGGDGGNGRVQFIYTPSAQEINVTGNGVSIVDGAISTSAVNNTSFGTGNIINKTFIIQNTGGTNLTIGAITFSGTHAAEFTVTTAPSATVAPCSSTSFVVTFTRVAAGVRAATIAIANNDSDENPYDFALTATGVPNGPEMDVFGNGVAIVDGDTTPSVADFTDFNGQGSREFSVFNNGTSVLTLSGSPRVSITGTDAASFFVISNPDPTVAAGATTVFTIGFSPSTLGVKNATIVIANDDINENSYDFAISATATAREIDIRGDVTSIPSGNVTFSTTNLTDFRQVIIGSSWTNTFVIHNTGSLPLTLPATSVSSNNAKFTIIQPAAVIIPGNSSYEFYVSYTPTTAVTDTATITVLNNDADESVYTFNIRGTGLVGTVLVQPGCLGGSAPKCAAASNGSFASGSAGWTVSNWTYDGSGGNGGGGGMRFDGSGSSPTGYIRQSLTGLTSTSTSVLISFDIRIAYNGCNPDFKYIDLGVRFGGVEYLVITRQVPGTVEAPLNLYNGGILVATSSSIFAGKEGGGGCDNALWYKVYLQVPKAAGVTTGDLEFYADENNGKFANQLKMYIDNITATADAGTCGFVWLRADAGTSTTTNATGIARWDDQVLVDGGSAAEVATFPRQDDPASRPSYFTNVMNGNPGIYFDGVNDQLSSTAEKYSSVTSIIVFKPSGTINSASSGKTLLGANITKVANDISGVGLGDISANLTNETYGIVRGTGASGWATGVAAGPITALANMINIYPNAAIPATDWVPTKNGVAGMAINGGSGYGQWAGQPYTLGASPGPTAVSFARFYQGYIMEVLNYPSSFTALDRTKVESYLATKYGISLGKDYRAGFGATTYTIAGGFDQRIFGIGREDCMSFHQRISSCQSDTAESMLTIGYNGLISASNSSTAGNNLPNNAYVMIGDDNGARSSWVTTGAPVAEISEATRINRAFKLKVTGSPTSNIRFSLDGTKLPAVAANERVAMVIAGTLSDIPLATFTGSINKIIPMSKSGTNWILNVDVSGYSTAYFTFIRYKDCYTDLVCTGTTKIWSGAWAPSAPTVSDVVLINSNYSTATSGNFTCCKLTVNATLTISSGALVQVQSNIVNNGSIVIQNNGSLMQYQDNATNTGAGTLTITRTAQPMYRGDYTYWSAPVVGYDISNIPTNSGRRYTWSPSANNWTFASGIMQSGKGYIVMTNNTNLTTATTTTINFTGSLFNGRINTDVYTSNDNYNLLGNPYPSALNADDFILENHTAGRTTGGLYFWTHNTRIDEFNTRLAGSFSQSDYAVYTLAGGTSPASSSTGVYDANGSLITYGGNISAPNGYIAAGQAFFVEAVVNSKATFKNCMRTTSAGLNNNFYRTEESQITGKNRLWLDLINESGSFKQILFGYFDGADDDLDGLYDAKVNNGNNNVSLYSILEDKKSKKKVKLSVQGKSNNFKETDEIPLGVQISKEASVKNTISLSKYEGLFEKQDVFIEDKLTETIHNLKLSNYTFEVQEGESDDRFVLSFRDKTLTSETELTYKTTTVLSKDQNIIIMSNNKIKDVMIYDVLGRLLYEKKDISSLGHTITKVQKDNSLHVVVIYLENGQKEITKVVY